MKTITKKSETSAEKTRGRSKKFKVRDEDFVTSSYMHQGGIIHRCVKVAIGSCRVAIRDSKDLNKTTLFFNRNEWKAFVQGVKDGEFDLKKK